MGGFWFVYPFALGIGLVFFSWFACWPCMWGLVNVGGLCVVVVSFPSFWGGGGGGRHSLYFRFSLALVGHVLLDWVHGGFCFRLMPISYVLGGVLSVFHFF